ncbi:MAG: nucleoside hydrolase [Halanaerobiales bacterium]
MKFPVIEEKNRLNSLKYPEGKIKMILDTDTYNEVDDQFALAYALKSQDKLDIEAIYAAPFYNDRSKNPEDGMKKSYYEIIKIMKKMGYNNEEKVFKGSTDYIKDYDNPQISAAAEDLIGRVESLTSEEKLYVVAIGAITNIASAVLMEPEIIKDIVIIWLGGHAHYWPDTKEFNLSQDILASRVIFDCGVPLIQIPCMGVASHLQTNVPELKYYLSESDIGQYLINIVENYTDNPHGWSKVIWDISTIGYLINKNWVKTELVHSPVLTDQVTWSFDNSRHLIKVARWIDRDGIFSDLFNKIN